jgi:hypothetical protein
MAIELLDWKSIKICGCIAPDKKSVFNAQPKSGSKIVKEGSLSNEKPQESTGATQRACKCGNSTLSADAQSISAASAQPPNASSANQ